MTEINQFCAEIRQELARLANERNGIPAQLEQAVRQGDGAEVRRLKNRQAELDDQIFSFAEDTQKRLAEFGPEARKPLLKAVRDAEAEQLRARERLEKTKQENQERERAALEGVRQADQAYNDAYADHRFGADELAAVEGEMKQIFAKVAAV